MTGSPGSGRDGPQIRNALGILFVLPLADTIATRHLGRALLFVTALFLPSTSLHRQPALIVASAVLAATTVIPQILIPVISATPA